jgi:hypothetical protein
VPILYGGVAEAAMAMLLVLQLLQASALQSTSSSSCSYAVVYVMPSNCWHADIGLLQPT